MLTFEDYEKLIKEAEINIAKANGFMHGMKLQYLEKKVRELDIRKGDLIEISFSDGVEKCIYEEINYSYFVRIVVRHFTTKGKPFKTFTFYDWDILEIVKKSKGVPE